jgi:hypothetical protein
MPIRAYGIKWERAQVEWRPPAGELMLLGSKGDALVNARDQRGIYVLYQGDELLYLGLARENLGKRLVGHLTQERLREFERFSWFGFCPVTDTVLEDGTRRLRDVSSLNLGDSKTAITDVQSLMIRLMRPPGNWRFDPFKQADEWRQVKRG